MAGSTGSSPMGDGDRTDETLPAAVTAGVPEPLRTDGDYRAVLRQLLARDGRCSLSELTAALVDRAGWPPDGTASTNPYQLAHLALVRQYLPVLSDFDVVEYDEETGTVTLIAVEEAEVCGELP